MREPAWLEERRRRESIPRKLVLVALAFGTALFLVAATSHRTWSCTICGRQAERWTVLGIGRESGPPRDVEEENEVSRRFESWFAREVALAHRHDWIPVGCAALFGGGVGCAEYPNTVRFRALPHAPDALVARRIAVRSAELSADELRASASHFGSESPWRELAAGVELDASTFREQLETWLVRHPEWR